MRLQHFQKGRRQKLSDGIGVCFTLMNSKRCIVLQQEYIRSSTKAQTGDFTLEGKNIYASTTSRAKITVSSGTFSFESGGGSITIKTVSPMKDDYSFSIDYKEEAYQASRSNDDDVLSDSYYSNGSNGNGETPPSTATIPDRPASFSVSGRRTRIRLSWTDTAFNGGSSITDYQYQYRRKLTATRWEAWSSWKSGGTGTFTWITGLTPNRRYSVRMRAVNGVGPSSATGFEIVDTTR